jgi:hypothetical protein
MPVLFFFVSQTSQTGKSPLKLALMGAKPRTETGSLKRGQKEKSKTKVKNKVKSDGQGVPALHRQLQLR